MDRDEMSMPVARLVGTTLEQSKKYKNPLL